MSTLAIHRSLSRPRIVVSTSLLLMSGLLYGAIECGPYGINNDGTPSLGCGPCEDWSWELFSSCGIADLDDDGVGGADGGSTSFLPFGPSPAAPGSGGRYAPPTGQTMMEVSNSNAYSQSMDLQVHNAVGMLPLELKRTYQTRSRAGTGDAMGHGTNWTHSYSWKMWLDGSRRTISFPDGTWLKFTQGASKIFEGQTVIEHLPDAGIGHRLYENGNFFTLVIPGGARQVFERVTEVDSTIRYYPRYGLDARGRQLTYTTDSQARIVGVVDAGGNGLALTYGGILVNRKAEVLIHQVTAAPSTGWNEVTLTTPVPYRWLQGVSAPGTYFNIAEIEFHKPIDPANPSAPTLLGGTVYGTDPASGNSLSLRYPKALDGNITTGFKYGRPNEGIAGIDLGAGNESYVGKIRFMPRTGANTPAMAEHIRLRFVALVEQPEIVEVLQRVETNDGRAVNYLYDTHYDPSIGQNHLVFVGVDYDGDALATSPGEARFTWTTAQQGTGPVIGIHNEPRSTRKEKQLKFEYVSPAVGTKGMIARVAHATTNETILANDPQSVRTLTTPGGRLTKMAYTSASPGNFAYVTSAAGHKTDFSWNAQRFLAKKTDAAGRATTFTWNAIGKRTGVTRPDGLVQTAAFDASGRVTGKTTTAAGPRF
jgi:YD repeat-containing protein